MACSPVADGKLSTTSACCRCNFSAVRIQTRVGSLHLSPGDLQARTFQLQPPRPVCHSPAFTLADAIMQHPWSDPSARRATLHRGKHQACSPSEKHSPLCWAAARARYPLLCEFLGRRSQLRPWRSAPKESRDGQEKPARLLKTRNCKAMRAMRLQSGFHILCAEQGCLQLQSVCVRAYPREGGGKTTPADCV
jgi:hypothetical protein